MANEQYPDRYHDELRDDPEYDNLTPTQEAEEEIEDMIRMHAIAYAVAWQFRQNFITLREYMEILDAAEDEFEKAPMV